MEAGWHGGCKYSERILSRGASPPTTLLKIYGMSDLLGLVAYERAGLVRFWNQSGIGTATGRCSRDHARQAARDVRPDSCSGASLNHTNRKGTA